MSSFSSAVEIFFVQRWFTPLEKLARALRPIDIYDDQQILHQLPTNNEQIRACHVRDTISRSSVVGLENTCVGDR